MQRKRSRHFVTLGLAKVKVDTFKYTLVMKNANALVDALDYRLTEVWHALTSYWRKRFRHSVTPRLGKGVGTAQDTRLADKPTQD